MEEAEKQEWDFGGYIKLIDAGDIILIDSGQKQQNAPKNEEKTA